MQSSEGTIPQQQSDGRNIVPEPVDNHASNSEDVAAPKDDASSNPSILTDANRSSSESSSTTSSRKDEDNQEDLDVEGYGSGHSWASDEYEALDLNYDALKHVATCYVPGDHGKCTNIETLERGSFHEIRILEFADGWSCIGRFTRNKHEHLSITESEIATVKYVRQHTTIPVPETYFVNFDPTHAVGSAFVLMERMQGIHLYAIWEKLNTDQRFAVVEQIADVLAQLASLKFEKIGSINIHGEVGPLQSHAIPPTSSARGPFSSVADYMLSFVPDVSQSPAKVKAYYPEIRLRVRKYVEDQTDDPIYNPPFRLIHGDFDAQNLLFTWPDRSQSPKLSGVIDWDYSYTGPLYYLFEYPIFIQDVDLSAATEAKYPENKLLRKNLVRFLAQRSPKGSIEREDARECFRQKSFIMNIYRNFFMTFGWKNAEQELNRVQRYADEICDRGDEEWFPYTGRCDWEPDSELESEVEVDK
ncbi:hypothetical protein LTR37_008845 [Vermiconidia calcicola]|uniref:Uncharacterized protein n=1 Tax=Vermiconidia calcicola TaxID=1690605 RepID=A0ACC3NAB9_9PEZI|nr:hypothetical protein LTR37_008845 [Vermiconidia calcicola]